MTGFLRELKRRRVLHTVSLYIIGAWVALQVVEVLSGAGLPPSTMRNLLVILSLGFPIALVAGWFFDISRDGITRTGPLTEGEQLPELKFTDHVLLAGLLMVMGMDVYILSLPPPNDAVQPISSTSQQRTIAVLGFADLELADGEDPVGEVFAGELRSSLTRVAGLRVLGPETSKVLSLAGENQLAVAAEMLVTAFLVGHVQLVGNRIQVQAHLVGVPAGNELWSSSVAGPVADAVELQQGLLRQVVGAVAPKLDPDPVQGPRAETGACADVYDLYLRGKQLSMRRPSEGDMRERGAELLSEAVAIDDQCALAWEAIAVEAIGYYGMQRLVKAGSAARRALELNEALPEAWGVLAEIAEEEERWMDSEEYFLRALYADPTNAHVNMMYGEALITRGRVRDGLHYALEAYRYDPASANINNHVALAAMRVGDGDLTIKHAMIFGDLMGHPKHSFVLISIAEGYLLQGETERAIETITDIGFNAGDWYLDCARVRDDPSLIPVVGEAVRETLGQYLSGTLEKTGLYMRGWALIRCGTWLGEPDIVFDMLFAKGVPPFEDGVPTEILFINFFFPDAKVLRQDPRFRELVVDSGLLDYWKKWGWSDFCRPNDDSFVCD